MIEHLPASNSTSPASQGVRSTQPKRVLIATGPLDHEGGVANYYRVFVNRFRNDGLELVHHIFGSRMKHFYSPFKKRLLYPLYYVSDYCRFILRLAGDRQICIVQVSPSLIPVPLLRDAFVLIGAKLLRRRTIVFFRGWKPHIVAVLRQHGWARWLFRLVYGRCDCAVVLAERFREELAEFFTPSGGIEVTTTMFEKESLLPAMDRQGQVPRFLFLGRVSELKGIGELIEAACILQEQGQDFEVEIVGHGDRRGAAEHYEDLSRKKGLANRLHFRGRLTGEEKFRSYADSDVYTLPSWTEGCPTSVLEALGSGLFVLATDVGALAEIIDEGANGRLIGVRDANDLAEKMRWACDHIEELRNAREEISSWSQDRFETQVVIRQFADLYNRLLKKHGVSEKTDDQT